MPTRLLHAARKLPGIGLLVRAEAHGRQPPVSEPGLLFGRGEMPDPAGVHVLADGGARRSSANFWKTIANTRRDKPQRFCVLVEDGFAQYGRRDEASP